MNIILASSSPARKRLMDALKIPYHCHASEIFEDMEKYSDPLKLVKYLATEKAKSVAPKYPDALLIGVDTFILIGKEKIIKAQTIKDAEEILRKMSGNTIEVISGLAVLKTDDKAKITEKHVSHAVTSLKIKPLTKVEINYFARREEALKISGVFGIEGEGGRLIKQINGDFNNVVGIPIFQLKEVLKKYGVETN
jgi:septum formation protein